MPKDAQFWIKSPRSICLRLFHLATEVKYSVMELRKRLCLPGSDLLGEWWYTAGSPETLNPTL